MRNALLFFLLFYRDKSVRPIFIFNTRAYRASHSGGRAKTHGFCLKFARGEEGWCIVELETCCASRKWKFVDPHRADDKLPLLRLRNGDPARPGLDIPKRSFSSSLRYFRSVLGTENDSVGKRQGGREQGQRGRGIDAILRECGKSNYEPGPRDDGSCIVRLLFTAYKVWKMVSSRFQSGMIIKKEREKSRGGLIRSALPSCASFTVI